MSAPPALRIEPIGVGDLLTITRMAYANMAGVDERFTELIRNPLGRWLGYLVFPFYFLFAGQGYKAVLDGRIAGCAYLHLRQDSGFVFNVSVNRRYRRQGIGSAMMHHLEAITRRRRRRWSALQVDRSNGPARAMYAALGYRPYHPDFLRRADGVDSPEAAVNGVEWGNLDGQDGRRLLGQYLARERRQGDPWAAGVAGDYQPELQGRMRFWRCRLHGIEVGVAMSVVSGDHCQLRLALDPAYWGHPSLPGMVRRLAEQARSTAETIDVYLGSSAHHREAAPLLAGYGFAARTQDRILMLKRLED